MSTQPQRPIIGIILMIGAMMLVPVLDLFAKLLSSDYTVLQVTWARFFFHCLWLLPLLTWQRLKWWKLPPKPAYQLIRSLLLTATTLLFFLSIRDNPIPNALTLLFVSPLVVAVIAPFFLNESFDWRRGIAVVCGFIGILVVLRPASDAFSFSLVWALLAGIGYAFYIMVTRKLSLSSAPLITLFYTAVGGLVVLTPLVVIFWQTPDLSGWLKMAGMGFFAASGHFMIIKACDYASASQLGPFNYFEIVGATLISYFAFGYWPDRYVFLGVFIIGMSGLYISWREVKLSRITRQWEDERLDKL